MESLLIGKVIDNYEIVKVLGRGGMGTVLKAIDRNLDMPVALKLLDSRFTANPEFVKRFYIEGKSQARLTHPNIVRIHALRESHLGIFIVMEYVDGENLKEFMERKGRLSWKIALPIFRQICQAISHAHANDIKPRNIMISRSGAVKVTDFGLAKIQHDFGQTESSFAAGTIEYSSPEQLVSLKKTDHRSDIYSLGMTLYVMLTGRVPFEDTSTTLSRQIAIVEGKIPAPRTLAPEIPPKLEHIILKAIAKDPEKRYASVGEFTAALDAFEKSPAPQPQPLPDPPVPNLLEQWKIRLTRGVQQIGQKSKTIFREMQTRFQKLDRNLGLATAGTAALVVLLLFLWARLAPSHVELSLTSDPDGVQVLLNGVRLGSTPLVHRAAPGDTLALTFRKATFFPFDTTIVANRPVGKIAVTMRPAAYIAITVTPQDATVYIDNQPVDTLARQDLRLTVGEHTLIAEKAGYETLHETFTVSQGYNEARTYTLKQTRRGPSAQVGQLTVTSVPPGAEIWIDGYNSRRTTPATFSRMPTRSVVVALHKAGHQTYVERVVIRADRTTHISAVLRVDPVLPSQVRQGRLTIHLAQKASIYIDGLPHQINAAAPYTVQLNAGDWHTVKVTHPVHGLWIQKVRLSQEEVVLSVDFRKRRAVKIFAYEVPSNHSLSGGQIYIDGEKTNYRVPEEFRINPGKHQFEVRMPGYRQVRIEGGAVAEKPPGGALIKVYLEKTE